MLRIGAHRLVVAFLLLALAGLGFALAATASSADAVWPESPGTNLLTDGRLVVDASHMDLGYITCRVDSPTDHRLKLRMTYGDVQLTYDMKGDAGYEVFPLQLGSGSYEFSLFENVKANKYAGKGKVQLSVQLADENAPFLVPNQYVNYARDTNAVLKSDELASQGEIYSAVCDFMTREFGYDFVRAKTIGPGELPEIEACFDSRLGICQDLSAVMVCMLRVQGIPARLMVGYADQYYHAWTAALVNGKEVFFDPTAAIGCIKASKYTTEKYF